MSQSPPQNNRDLRDLFVRKVRAVTLSSMLLILLGCHASRTSQSATSKPLPVNCVRVTPVDVPLRGDWVGTLDGYVNAQIQPQVSGYLVAQKYREGSKVTKGQILFEIDRRPFEAALEQAEGQVGQARGQFEQTQAQLRLAEINVERDAPLAQQRAISQSQLDNEKQQLAQAQAAAKTSLEAIATANANVSAAKLNLGFTQVKSLITGVAGQATTQVGNLVGPQSTLTSVSQLDPIKAYFSISDRDYLRLSKRAEQGGQSLLQIADKLPLTLQLADGDTYTYPGHIIFVDRQINQQTGAIRVAAAFPNPHALLRPGQYGRITATAEVVPHALLIPQTAVLEIQGVKEVETVDDRNHVHVVNVVLGPQIGTNFIVTLGVQAGARVITSNLQKLSEGLLVEATEISLSAAVGQTSTTETTAGGR
ncbi:efflux RND transporter periplasmic adaptor subunit [Acidicapsa ligni]|uniref:efflux RND transporter periplasmic adaptor subunit n=1 Tax=Acidicapsa ligni TaxID=542300 RepID=UPI0021DFDAF8|nr:efflux RND transporter periplasmic adaptor subunit [Acidicapsa ligni]